MGKIENGVLYISLPLLILFISSPYLFQSYFKDSNKKWTSILISIFMILFMVIIYIKYDFPLIPGAAGAGGDLHNVGNCIKTGLKGGLASIFLFIVVITIIHVILKLIISFAAEVAPGSTTFGRRSDWISDLINKLSKGFWYIWDNVKFVIDYGNTEDPTKEIQKEQQELKELIFNCDKVDSLDTLSARKYCSDSGDSSCKIDIILICIELVILVFLPLIVISSDVGGIAAWLNDARCGHVFDVGLHHRLGKLIFVIFIYIAYISLLFFIPILTATIKNIVRQEDSNNGEFPEWESWPDSDPPLEYFHSDLYNDYKSKTCPTATCEATHTITCSALDESSCGINTHCTWDNRTCLAAAATPSNVCQAEAVNGELACRGVEVNGVGDQCTYTSSIHNIKNLSIYEIHEKQKNCKDHHNCTFIIKSNGDMVCLDDNVGNIQNLFLGSPDSCTQGGEKGCYPNPNSGGDVNLIEQLCDSVNRTLEPEHYCDEIPSCKWYDSCYKDSFKKVVEYPLGENKGVVYASCSNFPNIELEGSGNEIRNEIRDLKTIYHLKDNLSNKNENKCKINDNDGECTSGVCESV